MGCFLDEECQELRLGPGLQALWLRRRSELELLLSERSVRLALRSWLLA
jgi:hypothetical protein